MSNDGSNYGTTYAEDVTLDPTKVPLKRRTGWRPRQLNDPDAIATGTGVGTAAAPGPPTQIAPPPEARWTEDDADEGGYSEDEGGYSEDTGYPEQAYEGAPQERPRGRVGGGYRPPERGPMYYSPDESNYAVNVARVNSEYQERLDGIQQDHYNAIGSKPDDPTGAEHYMQRKAELDKWQKDQLAVAETNRVKIAAHEAGALGQSQAIQRDKAELENLPAGKARDDALAAAEYGEQITGLEERSIAEVEQHNKYAAEAERQAGERQAEVYDRIQEADAAVQATHIDPGRSWRNKNAPMKILSMFAAALNGYITAIQGRENEVLKMIDREIERDVDAQKADLQTRKAGAAATRSEYAVLKDKIGDEAVARNMLIARKLRSTRAQQQQVAAGAKTDEQRRMAAVIDEGMGRRIELVESGIKLNATVMRDQLAMQDQQRAAASAQQARAAEARASDPMGHLNWQKGNRRDWALYLRTGGGIVKNEKDYDTLAKQFAQTKVLQDLLTEAKALGSDGKWSPTERALGRQFGERIMYAVNASALGDDSVIKEPEVERFEKNLVMPTDFSVVDYQRSIDNLGGMVNMAMERAAEGRIEPAVMRRDQAGDIQIIRLQDNPAISKASIKAAEKRAGY